MTKVSVIISTYNRPKLLKNAVQSALDQNLEDMEIIIVNDFSDPKYRSQLQEVVGLSSKIQLIDNHENFGVSCSRNKGLDLAKGEFVLFLDDDDVLLPNILEETLAVIKDGNFDVVSWQCEIEGDGISDQKKRRYNKRPKKDTLLYHLEDQPIEHLSLYHPQIHSFLVRRNAISDLRFMRYRNYGEDLLFWLQLARKGLTFTKIDTVGSRYYIHASSASVSTSNHEKIRFYLFLLNTMSVSRAVKNLCWIKLAVLGVKALDLRFILWLINAFLNPVDSFRHIRYYFGLIR
ncbi:MAG: glycosyltransferase family 2 protein [Reichenbachiella sp.]|uniref:glycosyltransferase family 2 protein n=1 Tax=Reichenbachiella sp. TaxID=2184521 RepID=UPI003263381E